MKAHKGIPLLHSTSNYQRWHSKVIMHLESLGLKDHMTGLAIMPKKLHQSKLDLSLTLGTIKKLVNDDLLLSIEGATTTKAVLDILKAQLVVKNTAQFITTICKLFSLKKKPEQSVTVYFAKLDRLIMLTVANTAKDIKHHVALPDPNALMIGQLSPFTITYSNNLLHCYITKHATTITLARLPEEYKMARAIISNWPEFDANHACAKISKHEVEITHTNSPSGHRSSDKLLYTKVPDTCSLYHSSAHHSQQQGSKSHHLRSYGNRPASAASSSEQSQKPLFQKHDHPLCNYCWHPGHMCAVCQRRLADTKQANVANKVGTPKTTDLADMVTLVVTETKLTLISADPHVTLWYLDSGMTSHMATNHNWFQSYKQLSSHLVALGDNHTIHATGQGTIKASGQVTGQQQKIQLCDMLHVPNLAQNLLSTSHFTSTGLTIKILAQDCKVFSKRSCQVILRPVTLGHMLVASLHINTASGKHALTIKVPPINLELLHHCLGHISKHHIHASTSTVKAIPQGDSIKQCKICIHAKQTQAPISIGPVQHAKVTLELMHSDLCRPLTKTPGGCCYFVLFIDDYMRYT